MHMSSASHMAMEVLASQAGQPFDMQMRQFAFMNNQKLIVWEFRRPQVLVTFGLHHLIPLIEVTVKAILEAEHFQ